MLTLQEHLDRLALGCLSNTALVSEESGSIRESAVSTVIAALNVAILAIHSRVTLRYKTIYIHKVPGMGTYTLDERYTFRKRDEYEAEQDPFSPDYVPYPYVPFIEEAEDLYQNDLLTIESLSDDSGERYLTTLSQVGTLTLNFDKIPEKRYTLRYRSSGTVIPYDALPDYVVDVPNIALSALDAYVAYEIFLGLGSNEALGRVRDYMHAYETHLMRLTEHLVTDYEPETTEGFMRNGWV